MYYLVDGSHLGFRAHFAFPNLSVAGTRISAVFGVIKILTPLIKSFTPGKLVVAFDAGGSIHRKKLYPAYKGQRNDDPHMKRERDAFYAQLPVLTDLLRMLGIIVLSEETKGFEADDCIAYLAAKADKAVVISSDQDLCALVNNKVSFYDPMHDLVINEKNFEDQFGVRVDQYMDFKVLKGDKGDNIPHPPGLGPKTAQKLLKEYGSVAKLIEARHEKVYPYKETVALAESLIRLDLHKQLSEDPIWNRIDEAVTQKRQVDLQLRDAFEALEFSSLLENFDELVKLYELWAEQ